MIDEVVTDFLVVYNPIVRAARARAGWFPMPELTLRHGQGLSYHVLYCIDNETSGDAAWAQYWASREGGNPWAAGYMDAVCAPVADSCYGTWACA